MRNHSCALAVACLFGCLTIGPTRGWTEEAQPDAESPVVAPSPVSAEQIANWVRGLASDSFRARRLATRSLIEAGSAAVEPVASAADTDDLELTTRCIDILKALHRSENKHVQTTAEDALKKLAESPRASVAGRAAEAIKQPEPPAPANRLGNLRIQVQFAPGGGIQIGRPKLQREIDVEEDGKKIHITETLGREIVVKVTEKVNGKEKTTEYKARNSAQLKQKHPDIHKIFLKHMRGPGAPRVRRVAGGVAAAVQGRGVKIQQTNVNGHRETNVELDGKKIHIADNQGKDITVKVTETVDGKAKTSEYKAKDLDELKKKHPDAAKLYEQYADGRNNAAGIFQGRIQIGGGPAQVLPIQIPQIQIGPRRAANPDEAGNQAASKQIEEARRQLAKTTQRLKQLAGADEVEPAKLNELINELDAAIQRLDEAKKKLEP